MSASGASMEVTSATSKNLEQEEERLREKLKAKSLEKQRRDSASASPTHDEGKPRSKSPSSSPPGRHERDRRRSRSRSSSRQRYGRSDSPPGRPRDDYGRSRTGENARYSRHSRHEDPYYYDRHDYRPPPSGRRDYDDRYDRRRRDRGGRDYHRDDHYGPPHDPYYGPPASRGRYPDHPGDKHYDDFGRERPARSSRSRSRSRSARRRSRSRSRSRRSRSTSSRSRSNSSSSHSHSSDESSMQSTGSIERESSMTKDQRTVFVNQLVQRASERDLRKYFNAKGFRVNEVIMLRDKRTGRHKGCAYVELRKLEYVQSCIAALNDQVPDFQKFPILIKASEAEKNYAATTTTTTTTSVVASNAALVAPVKGNTQMAALAAPVFPLDSFGNPIMAQKVYVGGLNPTVTHDHLLALFSPFGSLVSVQMQIDAATQTSKGFAFLQFVDPRDANLAIQSMSGQSLAGQALKTGWGNQVGGGNIVTSEEFPPDAAAKTQAAYSVLKQLNLGQAVATVLPATSATVTAGGGLIRTAPTAPQPGTVAEARASLAAAAAAAVTVGGPALLPPGMISAAAVAPVSTMDEAKQIGNAERPSRHILIHNMFDKDQETEPGWENEIKDEFESEAKKFGMLERCIIMSTEPGGKIYASFMSIEGAKTCASTLAGRWFDKRQLRVEFVQEGAVPTLQ